MRTVAGILSVAALAVLLVGCVPGQPQRAVETATGLAESYVGSGDGATDDFTCPGVTLDARADPAPDAQVTTGRPINQANGTIMVPVEIVIGSDRESYEVTLRQDGACVLAVD